VLFPNTQVTSWLNTLNTHYLWYILSQGKALWSINSIILKLYCTFQSWVILELLCKLFTEMVSTNNNGHKYIGLALNLLHVETISDHASLTVPRPLYYWVILTREHCQLPSYYRLPLQRTTLFPVLHIDMT